MSLEHIENDAVLLHDYSKQYSENIIPRQILQEPIISVMSECVPFMRTNLITSTGVSAMRVRDENEQANVRAANDAMYSAAISGDRLLPVVGTIDFQDLGTTTGTAKAQDFLLAYQSLNNLRMSGYGLGSSVFQKAEHMLQSESDMNNINTQLIIQDGLYQRQEFCNIVNSI
jgi:hypothetical protein